MSTPPKLSEIEKMMKLKSEVDAKIEAQAAEILRLQEENQIFRVRMSAMSIDPSCNSGVRVQLMGADLDLTHRRCAQLEAEMESLKAYIAGLNDGRAILRAERARLKKELGDCKVRYMKLFDDSGDLKSKCEIYEAELKRIEDVNSALRDNPDRSRGHSYGDWELRRIARQAILTASKIGEGES